MNPEITRAAEIEAAFLAGVETNLQQAKEDRFRGSKWTWTTRTEEDRVRELMQAQHHHDRDLLHAMPKNTARVLTAHQRRWLFWQKPSEVAIVSVLSPIEHLLDPSLGPPPPVGLAELVAHVKQLAGEANVPHLVGVCSPTGFTDDARQSGLDLPNVSLVLIEPRSDGGWTTVGCSRGVRPTDLRLFDPEAVTKKMERVRQEITVCGADLVTGGLSASLLAERLGLPVSLVARVFERMMATDRELRVSWQRGEAMLFRGAAVEAEDPEMSMVEWFRQLFGGEGEEARKINVLSERRARLAQRRDRLYDDIVKLEGRESELLKQGKEAASPTVKRRVATQIKQLRDEIDRLNTTAKMLGQQIDVISTHIHNLTLIQQGQGAKLPSTEEITQDAVRAEEMLEQLGADVDLATSLGTGVGDASITDEEMAILQELDGPAPTEPAPAPREAASPKREVIRPQPAPKQPDRGEPQAN